MTTETQTEPLLAALRAERTARKQAEARAKAAERRLREIRAFLSTLGDQMETHLTAIDIQATKKGTQP